MSPFQLPEQRGASPHRAHVLRPVTECNCVAARPGGEQQEVNDRSATQVNSIRPDTAVSPLGIDEAQTPSQGEGKPVALKGNVQQAMTGRVRWLEAERSEVLVQESERPVRKATAFIPDPSGRRTAGQESERP
jgi:hypothetical protein